MASQLDILDDQATAARYDVAKDQWATVIRVQIHFNEAIHRTRQLTATAVLATYGAALAYFASNSSKFLVAPYTGVAIHYSTPLVLLAFIFLFVGYMLDRHYYFRLLLSSVNAAMEAEKNFNLPIKLSTHLSGAVKPHQARRTIAIFYWSAVAVGLFIIWAVNTLAVLGSAS